MLSAHAIDAIFAAPLREEAVLWPADWTSNETVEAAKRRLFFHGISGLLIERQDLLAGWPETIIKAMQDEARARTMWELRHKMVLGEVLANLHAQIIPSALLKGTALAYSLYDNPACRFRGDTDLLIRKSGLEAVRQILPSLGWRRMANTHGRFGDMHCQEIWQLKDSTGLSHDIDLHWQVTNSMALRSVLDVDDVLDEAVPLKDLEPQARAAEPVAALIHGCVNRAVHERDGYYSIDRYEYDPNRLIWAYDFHLLATSLAAAQWEKFAALSDAKGVASICANALTFAHESLGTRIPQEVRDSLSADSQETPATRYIQNANLFEKRIADLRTTPGLLPKLTYVMAHAFPSPDHMRAKYPASSHWPIAVLYLRRQIEALMRLTKRQGD